MKSLHRLCVAFLLTLTLSLSAFAGVMSTTVAPPPPPAEAAAEGDMSTTVPSDSAATEREEASALSSMTEAALAALQSVLSLL